MMEKILDSIEKTETQLNDLLEALATYHDAIKQKDLPKAKEAISTFNEFTEKYWHKFSIDPPIFDDDSLSKVFGDVVFESSGRG